MTSLLFSIAPEAADSHVRCSENVLDFVGEPTDIIDQPHQLAGISMAERNIADMIPDGLLVVDEKGMTVSANLDFERKCGRSRSELVGTALETLLPQLSPNHRGLEVSVKSCPLAIPAGAFTIVAIHRLRT